MTNSLTSLGTWANAPLALVVAQVCYTPTPETDFRIVANLIKEALGNRFSMDNNVEQLAFVLGADGAPSITNEPTCVGVDLISEDARTCLRINNGAITFNTSDYRGWEEFIAEWEAMLTVLNATGPITATRIGLRYLDFILPSAGRKPEEYVIDGIGKSPASLGQAPISVSLYEYERASDGRLRVQYSRGFGPPMTPPDLQGTAAPYPGLMARYQGAESAILDMDRYAMLNKGMTASELAIEFSKLHTDLSESCQHIISPLELIEWRDETKEG